MNLSPSTWTPDCVARPYDNGTAAADYYRAMARVEQRLATQNESPTPAPSAGELLALVDSLRKGTLSANQQEALQALRVGILAFSYSQPAQPEKC